MGQVGWSLIVVRGWDMIQLGGVRQVVQRNLEWSEVILVAVT